MKVLLAAVGMLAAIIPVGIGVADSPLRAQSPDTSWEARAGGKRTFEVASVKPTKGFSPRFLFPFDTGDAKTPGGRFSFNLGLDAYVTFAYKMNSGDISLQLPKGFPEAFDIEARAPGNPTKDQMRLMVRSLLADRFKLRVHFETHEGPVYALTLVRPGHTGPKLHPHADDQPCADFEMGAGPPLPRESDVYPAVCGVIPTLGTREGKVIAGRDVTMEIFASTVYAYGSMFGEVDRHVIDQTGLKGRYDLRMDFPPGVPSFTFNVSAPNPDGTPADPKGTPFLKAIRDQLGLKLVSTKGPITKLVVDHVEPPSGN